MTPPGTLTRTADGGAELRFERWLRHPRERVWRAITEPDQLRAWGFPAVATFDLTAGAPVAFHPTHEQLTRFGVAPEPAAGRILRVDEPQLLEYSWGAEVLRWELHPDGDGCLLVFTNVVDDGDIATAAAAGWHAGLEVLTAVLDERAVDWDAWERAADLESEYLEH